MNLLAGAVARSHVKMRQIQAMSQRFKTNLVPRALSSFKMAVGETPGQGCRRGSKNWLEFFHVNTTKCLRFV